MKFLKISIAAVFIWIGFVCAISFLEAWLKFQAPGITLGLGLGIGKLVFGALNKLEWLFAIIVLFSAVQFKNIWTTQNVLFLFVLIILILQSFWLLPDLGHRADLIIEGKTPEKSALHFYYIGMEVVKLICLIIIGSKFLKSIK